MVKTFSFRIKDSTSAKHLYAMARAVNFVWNYCNEVQKKAANSHRPWVNWVMLNNLTSGCSKELRLHSQTIQAIDECYATSLKEAKSPTGKKKRFLRFRGRRSQGWIPFKASGIKLRKDSVVYQGRIFRFWKTRSIPEQIKGGNFSCDVRGRWYLNLVCEYEEALVSNEGSVGIDLGLKSLATLSNGKKYDAQKFFRKYERKLAHHQRCNNARQVRTIHAKIANSRKDFNHKVSHELTRDFNKVFIGDVDSLGLLKTRLAKSVSDASWGQLRTFIEYKAIARGGTYYVVDENNTTRTCSACGCLTGPSGLAGLRVREWQCKECGTVHDRDTNSAINIEQRGLSTLHSPLRTLSAKEEIP